MKYAILETNHTPHLSFARVKQNRKTKEIITPLSQVTGLHWACTTSR